MTGINPQEMERGILTIREQSVFVNVTIAYLFGGATKGVNPAISNNPDKFPPECIFELTTDVRREVAKNFYHLTKLKFSATLFGAFAEKDRYLLETVLQGWRMCATAIPQLLIS